MKTSSMRENPYSDRLVGAYGALGGISAPVRRSTASSAAIGLPIGADRMLHRL